MIYQYISAVFLLLASCTFVSALLAHAEAPITHLSLLMEK